jgi:FMN phosphatase YigB (HAD superfamily)
VNTTPLYIFDLDGTLADLKHRRHFVERPACRYCGWLKPCDHDKPLAEQRELRGERPKWKPNWDAFHAACVNDMPIAPVINMLKMLRASEYEPEIWVWSGRMETVSAETFTWLQDHRVRFNLLKMRPAGDYTPDDQLKESWLHALSPEDRARLVMTFDDRDRVVAMWRRNGVVCAQVAPGDF